MWPSRRCRLHWLQSHKFSLDCVGKCNHFTYRTVSGVTVIASMNSPNFCSTPCCTCERVQVRNVWLVGSWVGCSSSTTDQTEFWSRNWLSQGLPEIHEATSSFCPRFHRILWIVNASLPASVWNPSLNFLISLWWFELSHNPAQILLPQCVVEYLSRACNSPLVQQALTSKTHLQINPSVESLTDHGIWLHKVYQIWTLSNGLITCGFSPSISSRKSKSCEVISKFCKSKSLGLGRGESGAFLCGVVWLSWTFSQRGQWCLSPPWQYWSLRITLTGQISNEFNHGNSNSFRWTSPSCSPCTNTNLTSMNNQLKEWVSLSHSKT